MDYQRFIHPAMFGIAGVAVLAVLGVPVLAVVPYLLFLACPLMMVFMMRGMGHGGHGHGSHRHDEMTEEAPPPARDLR